MPKAPKPIPSHQNTQEVTKLTPEQELYFQLWARANKVTDVDSPDSYYDYRGWWKANGPKPVQFGVDHFEDRWKQHGHPTFSQESQYSKGPGDGGMWRGEQFIPQFEMTPSHEEAYKDGQGLIDAGMKRLESDKKQELKYKQDEQKSLLKQQDQQMKSEQKAKDQQMKAQEKEKAAFPKKVGSLVTALLDLDGDGVPDDPQKAWNKAQGIGPTPETPENGYKMGMMAPPPSMLRGNPLQQAKDPVEGLGKALKGNAMTLVGRLFKDRIREDFPSTEPYMDDPVNSILGLLRGR